MRESQVKNILIKKNSVEENYSKEEIFFKKAMLIMYFLRSSLYKKD